MQIQKACVEKLMTLRAVYLETLHVCCEYICLRDSIYLYSHICVWIFYFRINVKSVSMCDCVRVQALAVLQSRKRIGCMILRNFLHDIPRCLLSYSSLTSIYERIHYPTGSSYQKPATKIICFNNLSTMNSLEYSIIFRSLT